MYIIEKIIDIKKLVGLHFFSKP